MRLAARRLSTALASACVALAAAWPTAAAQAARAGQAEGVFAIGIPQAATAEEIAATETILDPAPALVQTVWDLGAAGDWDAAQKVLRALQSANPSWKAPANLRSYLAAGQRDEKIRSALGARDWAAALALLPATPASACDAPFHLWARADALEGLGTQTDITAFYVRSLTNCTAPDLTAALGDRALGVLDTDGLAAAAALPALAQSNDTAVRLAHTRLVRAERWQRFEAALARRDLAGAQVLAAGSDDPRLLTQAGWTFLETDAPRATTYFERAHALGGDAEALRGFVLATLSTGKVAAARAASAEAKERLTER